MSFPRYPEYKDSGVEWLGKVPAHWEVLPAKYRIKSESGSQTTKNTVSAAAEDGLFPAFSASGQDVWIKEFQYDASGIVLSAVGARCGKTYKADGKWGVVANTHCLFPKSASRDFLWYLTNREEWWERGGTAQPFIKVSETLARKWSFPPESEQATIAAFLDRETVKIDALVTEQEKLIALLKEKRQAVISHAVTKGLDPDVPMKDSGIEWLGEVPEHWTVASLRRVIRRIEQGWSPDCFGRPAEPDEWGVVKSGCVNRGVFVEQENKALPETLNPVPEYEIHTGDVLMSRASGSPELVGSTAYIAATRPKLMLSDKIFRIHPEPSVNREFFVAIFNSRIMRAQIERAISGAEGLANNLPQSALKGFLCVVPPLDEQKLIVSFLAGETAKFDALTAEAQRAIELLKERRNALISATVTGKIDVRGMATLEAAA